MPIGSREGLESIVSNITHKFSSSLKVLTFAPYSNRNDDTMLLNEIFPLSPSTSLVDLHIS
jgi:hypothetical protein